MSELDSFMGTWNEVDKEGFEEMAKALGLPAEKKQLYDMKTCISYSRDGDTWKINVGSVDHGSEAGRQFTFKLGESYPSADLDGSSMQSMVSADGPKLVEKHTSENGLEMDITRWIENGNMKVVCE
ncbi:hypothetical protein FSP39_010453 [Pinctada imbricata]|uniref:Uncharacterized protein n=1 Tax=Pinctada imbricata TaxID=66713 RepID=A0AA88XLW0_PINIB|nr:hypothetical protein FSP39_010453 [Pinctada imbricata]